MQRLGGPSDRCSLAQRQMSSRRIVVRFIGRHDPTQVRLTRHEGVVETLAVDRAKEPLHMPILSRREARPVANRSTRVLEGLGVAPGVAIGPAYLLEAGAVPVAVRQLSEAEIEPELERFR